jgi:RNA chaperone Hfq
MNCKNMNEDKFLDELVKGKTPISVYLLSGIKLAGSVLEAHDADALFLRQPIAQGGTLHMIYKINVSTVSAAAGKKLDRNHANILREALAV